MNEKIEYLKKYNPNISLVEEAEWENLNKSSLPKEWVEVFSIQNFDLRKIKILSLWDVVSSELRNTISYLKENLVQLDLIKISDSYSILYTIRNKTGKNVFYEGKNPNQKTINTGLNNIWEKLPNTLTAFYDKVHNGFYYYASESMGLVPVESVTYLDDLEWGILEDLKEPLKINLKCSFGFFTNGMGGYVVVDTETCEGDNATLWWAKKQPKYSINFWDVVDEWIVIGFDN